MPAQSLPQKPQFQTPLRKTNQQGGGVDIKWNGPTTWQILVLLYCECIYQISLNSMYDLLHSLVQKLKY